MSFLFGMAGPRALNCRQIDRGYSDAAPGSKGQVPRFIRHGHGHGKRPPDGNRTGLTCLTGSRSTPSTATRQQAQGGGIAVGRRIHLNRAARQKVADQFLDLVGVGELSHVVRAEHFLRRLGEFLKLAVDRQLAIGLAKAEGAFEDRTQRLAAQNLIPLGGIRRGPLCQTGKLPPCIQGKPQILIALADPRLELAFDILRGDLVGEAGLRGLRLPRGIEAESLSQTLIVLVRQPVRQAALSERSLSSTLRMNARLPMSPSRPKARRATFSKR